MGNNIIIIMRDLRFSAKARSRNISPVATLSALYWILTSSMSDRVGNRLESGEPEIEKRRTRTISRSDRFSASRRSKYRVWYAGRIMNST
jgi:hypothetical protein